MKILLICCGGMSTAILVKKIDNIAKNKNLKNLSIESRGNSIFNLDEGKWDVCLLAPQVSYVLNFIEKRLKIPVEVIDRGAYATCNSEEILNQALKAYKIYKSKV
jgi:cellobiose PTS system EIIB component